MHSGLEVKGLKSYLNHYKVAVITSLVDKISLFVTKISFVVDGMIFKVAVMAS